jgi:hypothetical protein
MDRGLNIRPCGDRVGHRLQLSCQSRWRCNWSLGPAAATAKLKLGAKDAAARAGHLIAGFEVFAHSVHAIQAALDEAPRGRFSFLDSVLLATAAEVGCTTIFSADMADGARFGSIAVANPFRRDGLSLRAKAVLDLE